MNAVMIEYTSASEAPNEWLEQGMKQCFIECGKIEGMNEHGIIE
jgi:hypothetical protein